MYEPPLEFVVKEICEKIGENVDAMVIQACFDAHVEVNRDELLAALKYDRGQYEKGVADGRAQAAEELVHCADCEYWQREWKPITAKDGTHFCANVGLCTSADWFCADGAKIDEGGASAAPTED